MADRYTLEEAERELARRECATHGHDFDIVVRMGGDPTSVLCQRCGKSWAIQLREVKDA